MDKVCANNPAVSIVMNCRNGEEYLRQALDSIYAQTYADWEIIFWDNASTDASPVIAKSYGPKLRYFRSEQCFILGKARNLAMAEAKGRYISFLDCDDKLLPQALEKRVRVLEKRADIDFVYGNYLRLIMPEKGNPIPVLKGRQPEGDVFGRFLYNYPVGIQTVMLRIDAIKRSGAKFDESLAVSEEFDFFMRILLRSQALYIDEPLAVYRIHQNMGSQRLRYKYPIEMRYILDKFKEIDSSIELKYSLQLRHYEAKLGYYKARASMEKDDQASARSSLSPYRFTSPVFFALYILTYLSPTAWKWLHSCKIEGRLRWVS